MNTQKIVVAVLMGGASAEHEVSLNSGAGVLKALEESPYTPLPVVIEKTGAWRFGEEAPVSILEGLQRLLTEKVDCVFIALHGPNGEDGRLQGLLDLLKLPYASSGCAASALAMDKIRCKEVVRAQGVRVAPHIGFGSLTWREDPEAVVDRIISELGLPCVLKAPSQGSSFGIEMPEDGEALRVAIGRLLKLEGRLLAEQLVRGVEVTCAVLDLKPGETRALPVTEIRPKTAAFFDYEAKYTPGASVEITPAEISAELTKAVQAAAVRAHHSVGCAIWSRSDFIIDEEGPVWIEVNTVPGLTETSLYPQAAAAAGISYAEMIQYFIEAALERAAREEQTPCP